MSDFDATFTVRTIRDGFHEVHQKIREVIHGLDADALNWKPHREANSIAAMVTHMLGSEREMLAAVRGVRVPRDRPSEFLASADAAGLGRLVDDADAWLEKQARGMTGDDLASDRPRGDRPPRPGLEWLVTNYGHAREHLAQIELTKQLYTAR